MPLGHTMVHLPQSMQQESIPDTSVPRCRPSMTLRMLIPEYCPAVQVALQLPHAMHVFMSGSSLSIFLYNERSALSRSMVELGESLNPNSIIC